MWLREGLCRKGDRGFARLQGFKGDGADRRLAGAGLADHEDDPAGFELAQHLGFQLRSRQRTAGADLPPGAAGNDREYS